MCWREGSQSSRYEACRRAEVPCPAKSSLAAPQVSGFKRNKQWYSGSPLMLGQGGRALLLPGPGVPRAGHPHPLLPGGGRGGSNILVCLFLSIESISQVSACTAHGTHPSIRPSLSVSVCYSPHTALHPSIYLLSTI